MGWNREGEDKRQARCNQNNGQFNDGSEEGSTTVAEIRKKSDAVIEGWNDHCTEQEF